MAGYFLSVQEQEALYHDVPPLAQRLYVLAIRPRMDKKTKLVGVNPKVSWRAFCEWLEFKGVQGIKKERLTESAVRRAAVHLEKVGMVENRSEGRQLILLLPLSVVDFSLSKKADRLGDSLGDSMKEAESPVNTGGYVNLSGIGEAKADEEADTHHTVLNCTVLNNTNAHVSVLTADQWMEVFVVEFQYRPADIHTPSCVVLFEDWHKRQITLSTVRPAFQMAVAQLGQRPDNPVYLRKFVDDYVRLSNRTAVQLSPVPLDAQRVWLVGGDAYVVAVSEAQAEQVYQQESGIALTEHHPATLQLDSESSLVVEDREVTAVECIQAWAANERAVPAVLHVIQGTPNA